MIETDFCARCFEMIEMELVPITGKAGWLFATVREKADGKGHYARIMTRGLCTQIHREIMRT